MTSDTVTVNALYKDLYPAAGTRIKQWVVEMGRESAWERETCPRVDVPSHNDNCGGGCRNVGSTQWMHLNHDSCYDCNDLQDATRERPDVVAWLAERAKRPPITTDREALSEEIAPDWSLTEHPMFRRLR